MVSAMCLLFFDFFGYFKRFHFNEINYDLISWCTLLLKYLALCNNLFSFKAQDILLSFIPLLLVLRHGDNPDEHGSVPFAITLLLLFCQPWCQAVSLHRRLTWLRLQPLLEAVAGIDGLTSFPQHVIISYQTIRLAQACKFDMTYVPTAAYLQSL